MTACDDKLSPDSSANWSRTPDNATLRDWARKPENQPPEWWWNDEDDLFAPVGGE